MSMNIRTDLALEERERLGEAELPGVEMLEEDISGFHVTTVNITSDEAAEQLNKPRGRYVTIELQKLLRRDDGAFIGGVAALAAEIKKLLPIDEGSAVLVAGLGNEAITSDSIGPLAVKSTMVTRHLVSSEPEIFGSLRPVTALEPGVLATTGVESAELVRAVAERVSPGAVLVIDALASLSLSRLCRTVQLADTGIVPGSGVGNSRAALNRETLGVPVIAIGVPTVVDAGTLAAELCGECGELPEGCEGMIVTPREIDEQAKSISKLIGYGINLALHSGITVDDVTMFLE